MKILPILTCALSLLLTACTMTTTPPKPTLSAPIASTASVEVAPGQSVNLPTPAQLNLNKRATQIVSAQYFINNAGQHYSSEVQVEANAKKVLLVAVSGWGGQLFMINYNGQTIQSSSLPMPNANIGIKHTLTDFIFTYASPEVLKAMLASSAIKVDIKPQQRIFTLNGEMIMQIDYQSLDPWQGKVVVHNIPLNYTVTIQTVNVEKIK